MNRRDCLALLSGLALGVPSLAMAAPSFSSWVASFRAKALGRGISPATYDRVMGALKPDASVFGQIRSQPEFKEALWQYLNRRVSDWRLTEGKDKLKEVGALLARIEQDYGVDRYVLLALWGIESAYGDPIVQKNHMRPVFPALAALAFGEPRRRAYWEQELINALRIVERGWSTPGEMRGSWAGAMGHTQWMPEVWLNIGLDYDGDGRVSPFGSPADALASTARYLVNRGKYRRGEHWGYEVRLPSGRRGGDRPKTYAAWQAAGVVRADGKAFSPANATAKLWVPVNGGPAFLLGQNFYAVRSYNPSMNYTLAIVHLADRLAGGGPFVQPFPGSERPLTLAEIQEVQKRLTASGFDTKGTDGRVGAATMVAVKAFQQKAGLVPADGYPGLKVLARLRRGG
ncbi:lytic murein transglycosylase [Astrobacterium formosum]|uniref:lytic murein transglycosylase n=1 Tax=Astrobacterium formosum TaxID=3069710 RepID=UPI003F5052CB